MKYFLTILLAFVLILGSCKNDSEDTKDDSTAIEKVDTNKIEQDNEVDISKSKEFTSKYICPMHCKGSGSDIAGTCPECGMEYIENPDYIAE